VSALRPVAAGEILVPGQPLLVVIEAPESVRTRSLDLLAALPGLAERDRADVAPNRSAGSYIATDAFTSAIVVDALLRVAASEGPAMAGFVASGQRPGFALLTANVGEIIARVAEEALNAAIDLPFRIFRKALGPIVPIVIGGLVLVGVGLYLGRK